MAEDKLMGRVFVPEKNIATEVEKLNSVALVRKRAILAERPPFVCEVTANFC
jgi:hypothetical protein